MGTRYVPDQDSSVSGRRVLDAHFSAAYEELRRLASSVRRSSPGVELSPTTLVNEAWLKLSHSPACAFTSPLHFRRIAARAMRQVLIEAARRRLADKRGGFGITFVTFDDSLDRAAGCSSAVLRLEDALQELEQVEPRQAILIESRFYGGLEMHEVALLLDVSESTLQREWRVAKAWLVQRMNHP